MSAEPERITYSIYVQPEGPFDEYIEATTDALGHALRMLDELGKAPGIASRGQEFCFADCDELRIQDDEDVVIKIWSREKGVIFEDLSQHSDVDIIGWQILNAEGHNIHGEPDDPFDMPSFTILVGDAANAARGWVASNPGYRVAPVRDGDIEEPEFVAMVGARQAPAMS